MCFRGFSCIRSNWLLLCLLGAILGLGTSCATDVPAPDEAERPEIAETVPDWVQDAVFYQIFPERFRNGDPSNDPTHAALEFPEQVPTSWTVSPWTGDWYARAAWEQETGDDFYQHGVFNRRYGGDLQGVVDKLDYLKDLGINTLYFNPLFYARSLHKYDGSSFHHIDPHFGPDPAGDFALMAQETSDPATWQWTQADQLFLRLLEEAHARQIRVVIDGVFNHTGRDFFAFADLRANQEASSYRDWYIVEQFDDPATPENEFDYEGWWDVKTLPVFADTPDGSDLHPGPKAYVMAATARWMDPNADGDPEDGIDGWRLDVANEVPLRFWADWNAHVRRLNPEAYTVTELWEEAGDFIQEGGFSATMNYHGFAFPVKGYLIDSALPPTAFAEQLNDRRAVHRPQVQYALQNLIDSHDTDRLASMIVNARRQPYEAEDRFDYDWGNRVSPRYTDIYDVRAPNAEERRIQRLVALFQMTYVGAPMIYYGTEAGMWGADDPDDRMPMVWEDLTYEPQRADPLGRARRPEAVSFDRKLFTFYQELIGLRQAQAALRRGTFDVLVADDAAQVLVYGRTEGAETAIVVLNRSDEPQSVQVPVEQQHSYRVLFATDQGSPTLQQSAEGLSMEVPPLTGLILQAAPAEAAQ